MPARDSLQPFVKHADAIYSLEDDAVGVKMSHSSSTVQWLFRAERGRSLADDIHDELAKRTMLSIAVGYDRLADMLCRWRTVACPLTKARPTLSTTSPTPIAFADRPASFRSPRNDDRHPNLRQAGSR